MPVVLLDTSVAGSVAPNRVRDLTPDPANNSTFGTLSIRRRIVNSTGVQVTRLRFRVTTITTYPVPSGTADLRVRTSTAFVTMNVNDANTCAATGTPATPPCEVTVQGTTLEQPPNQPNGGGYNSTLSVGLPQPLAPGASLNFQLLTGVQQTGSFQLFINVEASTDTASPRLDPVNQTGGEGEDPLSRNYNWNVPLVGLPGRAGLDLGLSLAYNSLVWTKSGSFMSFDDDRGFPSPGFRLGFPVIQPLHYNAQAAKNAFLLVTPNGDRVELRQVGTSPLYEAADSSYLLLDASTMTLRTMDGTQLSYTSMGSDFQCTQIKDRNGNFITITYTEFGRIDTVVDTLSRTIKFNYDGSDSLISITQNWTVTGAPQQHTWASFAYRNPNLTIQTNFPGLINVGPQNGSTLKVLASVTFADNSRFDFDYTSWGQVWKISNFAADGHLRNYRSYNLPLDSSTAQTDCPRFTERRDWARNWNGDTNGLPTPSEETTTGFAVPAAASWTMPDGTPQTGTLAQVTQPDLTSQKIYSHSSGWDKGLPLLSETYDSAQVRQRQSATTWTQDNTALVFPANPRVTETNVYDPAGNRARISVTYQNVSLPDGTSCRLPQDVFEYQANATTVLRRTHTDYNLATTYTNRRIIGLVSEKTLHQVDPSTQAETLMSMVGLEYDETGSIQGTDAPVQHDNLNYTASLVAGRGNLTSVKRYDVLNPALFVTSSMKYNTAGSVVQTTDPANHQVTMSYTDAFAANGTTLDPALSFVTLAYPTTETDADGYSSSTRYNYDFGAVTWKQTPLPNTDVNTPGPQQKMTYDSLGRVERVTNLVNNAYTRIIYGPNYVESFASVNNVADEARSLQVFDGAGRVIAKAGNHPGSTGGFSGQLLHYDAMGRSIKQSNPTETSISITGVPILPYGWPATGDDAVAGWVYTQQTYDWKGRPLVTTNTDGTTKEASYSGCGCAGGELVTLTDEGAVVDWSGTFKKRQQKIYSDVLGRTVKAEILNWDGTGPYGTGGTVYSTVTTTYNGRDQATSVKQFQGNEYSGIYQETTTTYDEYGRLKTQHVPGQSPGTATIFDYNPDDTVQKVTDPRGASATFSYNSRHLVIGTSYAAPAGITIPASISYEYDAAGNRSSMTDGVGSMTYLYDQVSRLTSETRAFTGVSGSFTLSYAYNLAGRLTSLTEPSQFGTSISYGYDTASHLTGVSSSGPGAMQYITGMQYRASGAAKHISYGNGVELNVTYNERMQPTNYALSNIYQYTYPPGYVTMGTENQYHADGRIRYARDLNNENYDRAYFYDHAARAKDAYSGRQARGFPPSGNADTPFTQSYSYDAWNNMGRTGTDWGIPRNDTPTYNNNRRSDWTYDTSGNVLERDFGWRHHTYSADGQQNNFQESGYETPISGGWLYFQNTIDLVYNGNGQPGKRVETRYTEDDQGTINNEVRNTHYLRSTVLGGAVVAGVDEWGDPKEGHIYAGGEKLVSLGVIRHVNPATGNWLTTNAYPGVTSASRTEMDPLGAIVGPYEQYAVDSYPEMMGLQSLYEERGNPFDWGGGCPTLDGLPISCSELQMRLDSNTVQVEYLITDRRPRDPHLHEPPEQILRLVTGEIRDLGLGLLGFAAPMVASDNEGVSWQPSREVRHFHHPQNPTPTPTPDPCASQLLVTFNLRDAGGEANINLIHKSEAENFRNALLEINKAVPGGIGFKDVFRDSAMQARRRAAYEAGRGAGARRPGTSSHEAGMAVDVALTDVQKNPIVVQIFAKYGWIRPFKSEDWHFEPKTFSASMIAEAQEFYRNCIPH